MTGGSWRATIMGEVRSSERLLISERNTSQLSRLLCCTMERERKILLAGGRGEGELVCCISSPGPSSQWGQERGWGQPRGADQRCLE